MSDKPKTRLAIVLDKSGSMASTKDAAIAGLNEQVQQARLNADKLDLRCSFVTFNGEVYEHLWDQPASELQEADSADFQPEGGTAMRDAMGYTIQKLLSTVGQDDSETSYLVYVISDGQTNSDRHYAPSLLAELIQGCQATKRWTFSYIGCDETYLRQVAAWSGIPLANMASWSNKNAHDARKGLVASSGSAGAYYTARSAGIIGTSNLCSSTPDCVADWTNDAEVEVATSGGIVLPDEVQAPVAVDMASVIMRSPRAATQSVNCAAGKGLFANTYGVKWE